MPFARPSSITYMAKIKHVKELRLIGSADHTYWARMLKNESFIPYVKEDKAEITISSTSLRWMGIGFQEFIIILAIADRANPTEQIGYYLIQAFNSNRFFTFSEKVFFATPYACGAPYLKEEKPFVLGVKLDEHTAFEAKMSTLERERQQVHDHWEGPIALPLKENKACKYFYVNLRGEMEILPYTSDDQIELNINTPYAIFSQLAESNFTPREWRLLPDAFHAKSKTYKYAL